jgi:MraZ protein
VELDKQGRLRIPPELADWAGAERDVVLVGVGDHMEIWNAAKWEAYADEKKQQYDSLAEAALNYTSTPMRQRPNN